MTVSTLETAEKLPNHIAIIMDGNGRWAKQRGLPRSIGHERGGRVARKIISACSNKKIKALTLFAFGCENWRRPSQEVNFLMGLFLNVLKKETRELQKNNVQLRFIGNLTAFNDKLQKQMYRSEQETAAGNGLKLNVAVNYSGRWDIVQATKKISEQINSGQLKPNDLTEDIFQSVLCLGDLPQPDLFIRTSGEQRISNFLLWQLAYTELYFTPLFWPEFDETELEKALTFYATRERRFGFTSDQLVKDELHAETADH